MDYRPMRTRVAGACVSLSQRAERAFTLIELLVVMAITAILMTVILGPLISSYDLTQRATTQVQSQATARATLDQIATVLGNAAYVFDNSGLSTPGSASTNTSLNIWLRNNQGAPIVVSSRFSMVEYVPAAKQLEQVADSQLGAPIDPTNMEPIYDQFAPSSQIGVGLPVLPGRMLGRIFVGLIDNTAVADSHVADLTFNPYDKPNTPSGKWSGMPSKPYGNEYEDPRTTGPGGSNRYTVYDAEAPIFIVDPTGATKSYVPNLRLFHIKDKTGAIHDVLSDYQNPTTRATMGLHVVVHDPNFFYDAQLAGDGSTTWAAPGWVDLNGDGKVEVWENWHATATNLLGNARKVDMIALDRDANTNAILYYDSTGTLLTGNANVGWPHVRPLARFAPATVQNDAAVASSLDATGNESPSPVPSIFATQFTHWANPYRVLVYRAANGGNPLTQSKLEYYETTDDGRIVHVQNLNPGSPPPDPTSLPDVGPMIDPTKNIFNNTAAEFAFDIDNERGTINFAFPSTVLIHDSAGNPLTAVFAPAAVNATANTTDPPRRYLSLETLDPAANPNMTDATLQPLSTAMKWYADVSIVPGTEVVFGPDQRPGPHYGSRIQYTRVPSKSLDPIRPNQYKLNYQNENDPQPATQHIELSRGFMEFRPGAEGSNVTNISDKAWTGGVYDPAVDYKPYGIPEFKANPSYDASQPPSNANPKFLPGGGEGTPSDPIEVFYKFQVNRPNDVVKVDYLTRELINVTVEARLYDQASARPMNTVLTQQLKVRNLQH